MVHAVSGALTTRTKAVVAVHLYGHPADVDRLARQCDVLIVDEPTRGVDVGAKAEIHQLLDELACQGIGLLVISSELPEVMNLSRRIMVLREGRVVGQLERKDFAQPALMRLMAGVAA